MQDEEFDYDEYDLNSGFAELAFAVESLRMIQRELGLSSFGVDELLREAEDGYLQGRGDAAATCAAEFDLGNGSQSALAAALATLAGVMRDRVQQATRRNAPKKKRAA